MDSEKKTGLCSDCGTQMIKAVDEQQPTWWCKLCKREIERETT